MRKLLTLSSAILVVTGLMIASCSKQATEPTSQLNSETSVTPSTGILKVLLTDAPGDFDEVNIHFASISARIDSEWVSMEIDTTTINLLEWTDGRTIELGSSDVPAGKYSQIRLMISSADIVVDSVTHDLKVPSGRQSGYKLITDFTIEEGYTHTIVFDFDAAKSVVIAGQPANPTKYILKPVLKLVSFVSDSTITDTTGTDTTIIDSTVIDTSIIDSLQ